MYTATWPKEVRKIAADLLVNPVQVNIGNVDELVANKSITQYIEVLAPMEKHRRLEQILRSQEPGSKIIIFCSTKKMCDQLARNLTRQFGAAAIHGDKSQGERDYVLNQFRTGRSPVLVATDVAARGLDIKDIRVVINYDFPTGVEDYVHRIGRTGRAGATGVAYTFFGDQDSKPRRWGSGPSGRDGGRGGRSDFGYGGREGGSWGLSSSSSSRPEKGGGRGYDYESRDRYERGYSDSYDRGRSRSRSPDRGSSWVDRSKSWNRDRSQSRSPDRVPLTRERSPVRSFHQAMMERARATSPAQNQQERSRSPYGGGSNSHKVSTREHSPVRSFHQAIIERARATSPAQNQRERSRSPYGGGNNSHKVSTREWSPGRSFHQAMMERGRAMTEKGRSSSFGAQQDQGRSPGSRHEGRGYNNVPQSRFGEEEEEGMIPADEDGMIPPDDEGMYRGADGNSHRS
ncbi:hypothetical protein GH714_041902 [Hevea brasiliensis]|uniref:RNA helicase n=1 Tax=Hevea brasiliensis TaxID=3981 RepID=A0A6A6MRX1_HEVBR|nr:hypothetical protein GH714_041902 [Hevea brasiliensis]